ncbi:MAG: hypothetical protein ACK5M3_09445 [Dysgonomonas sp.]
MKNIIRLIVIVLLAITSYSCTGNMIYFDMKDQTVKTCEKQRIVRLNIETDKGIYFVSLKKEEKGSNSFSLEKIDDQYEVEYKWEIIKNSSFKLEPNTEYIVRHTSDGDAADGRIHIKTDSLGAVCYADRTDCH